MSWAYTLQSNSPYVEHCHPPVTATLPQTPAQNFLSTWPTPSSESGLTSSQFRIFPKPDPKEHNTIAPGQALKRLIPPDQPKGLGLHVGTSTSLRHHQHITAPSCPQSSYISSGPSGKTLSSPATLKTPRAPSSNSVQPVRSSLYTPPSSTGSFQLLPQPQPQPQPLHAQNMEQQRRMSSHGQRPIMGPPETPSRGMIPQSPGLFSNIQFSPDLFSQQPMLEPQSAPVFPQQRLFWDPATATPIQTTPQQFHTPTAFPDDFSTSFNSNSTIVPQTFVTTAQNMPYDLPTVSQPMHSSFIDGSVFPAPFQTSPRLAPPPIENPTQFLSSPARRFGGEPHHDTGNPGRPMPDLPAYHHQIEESKREKEMLARQQRRKSRTLKRSQDEDLVMKSVRRALSPIKGTRPALTRSATFSAALSGARRSSSALDSVSLSSGTSSRSTRGGRSSPIRKIRDLSRRSSAGTTISRPRASVSLAIDDHGVARTIMNPLPEDDDDEMTDQTSSEDETDQHMLYSFADDPRSSYDSFTSRGDARDEIRSSNAHLSMGPDKVARISRAHPALDPRLTGHDPQSTIRRARGETLTSNHTDTTNGGNAQQALRALMQDRSRSASSHASSSSMQFHSSPPMPHAHLGGYNASPTTITDPDLATPSTDAGSHGSADATRCVCNSSSPDGNIMIQCDSCSKWLHAKCVGLTNRNIPDLYVCTFCEQTPMRGGTIRATARQTSFRQSPLAHKSNRRR